MEFDASLLVIAGLFWATYVVLRLLFFNPLGAMLDRRESMVESARELHERVLAETNEAIEVEREKLREARAEAATRREALRREADERRREVLEEAKAEAEKRLEAAGAKLADTVAAQRKVLDEKSRELADRMASRLLKVAS